MEPEYKPSTTQPYHMDIQSPAAKETPHRFRNIVITLMITILIASLVAMGLYVKQRNDYFKSTAGQLQLLRDSAIPVEKTTEERQDDLSDLKESSEPVTATKEQRIDMLKQLEQL